MTKEEYLEKVNYNNNREEIADRMLREKRLDQVRDLSYAIAEHVKAGKESVTIEKILTATSEEIKIAGNELLERLKKEFPFLMFSIVADDTIDDPENDLIREVDIEASWQVTDDENSASASSMFIYKNNESYAKYLKTKKAQAEKEEKRKAFLTRILISASIAFVVILLVGALIFAG